MRTDHDAALGMAQMLLQNELGEGVLTREQIVDVVNRVLGLNPRWRETIGRDALVSELETRFNVWIGRESTLTDDDDHRHWINAERKEGWDHWARYRTWVEDKWPAASIQAADRITSRVLGLLEDPRREGNWDRRGLVVGHVQSGKTANYTGLICKAADAGYKLIIVLAGLHNNLRSQTQMRLDEGFLGYESRPPREAEGRELKPVGVGLIDPHLRPDTITNRSERGDFNRTVANNFSMSPGGRPLLFVVKKNARVLRNLLDWVHWAANSQDAETGRPIVVDVPLLVIDDEADHASVDTGDQEFDESGNPDEEHDPTRINALVRQIVFAFEKSAYVGYTATPFANVFIHDRGRTAEHGDDLFPRSFIINLPAPSNYAGPVRIFGLEPDNEDASVRPLPLVRSLTDHADSLELNERGGWMPPRHRNGHHPLYHGRPEAPPSLSEAIQAFILACAARRGRGEENVHNSMLVHVTRYTSVQREVRTQVEEELQRIARRLRHGEGAEGDTVLGAMRRLWDEDFVPTTRTVAEETRDLNIYTLDWSAIEPCLANVAADIQIREINGTAGDILDYEEHSESGLNLIVIGGDKLARGLTLEGLSVSYFLRATRMYDTLMQMGRWFGYRSGYLDVCRLYTTPDLQEWFQHITEASEELRQEFDHMVAVRGTPRQYGLKVQSHPTLLVTSRVKMRNGLELDLSFAGSVSETVVFHRDQETKSRNFETAERFIERLGGPEEGDPARERPSGRAHRWKGALLWSGVPAEAVMRFLDDIVTHPDAYRANARLLKEYIEGQTGISELTSWTVVLMSGEKPWGGRIAGREISLVRRKPNERIENQKASGRYVIRRLLAPRDEAIDIEPEDYQAALEQTIREWHEDPGRSRRQTEPNTPSGPSIRERRNAALGLLLIYPVSPTAEPVDGEIPFIGFGLSFPSSKRARTVRYRVNNIYRAQELGEDV